MTMHLTKFVDRVRGHEARGSRDFVMSMHDAKDLHADITRLLIELHDFREQRAQPPQEEVITVKMDGGSF
jgi:DNA primase